MEGDLEHPGRTTRCMVPNYDGSGSWLQSQISVVCLSESVPLTCSVVLSCAQSVVCQGGRASTLRFVLPVGNPLEPCLPSTKTPADEEGSQVFLLL